MGLLRNMPRDRSSPGKSCDSFRSLLPRTGLKAEEAAESLALMRCGLFFIRFRCYKGADVRFLLSCACGF